MVKFILKEMERIKNKLSDMKINFWRALWLTRTQFTERFNELLKQKNMKQVDLLTAAANEGVKLSKSQISQYVSGRAVPRRNIGEFIAMTFGVDADWLYGEKIAEKGNINMREFKKSSKLDYVCI